MRSVARGGIALAQRFSQRGTLLAMVPVRVMAITTSVLAAGCLVTPPPDFPAEAPLTAPVIVDVQGLTTPRVGNIVSVVRGDAPARVTFRVPVDDANPDDQIQYQFFVNDNRDCLSSDAGVDCAPGRFGRRVATGERRRLITETLSFDTLGCNRVELWVSSGFVFGGNFRTPQRDGDFAFATWWVFVRAQPGAAGASDAGVTDPVESCANLVQP